MPGYVVLVLHAHLPYVLSHGKWPHGTDWLCEAACESYIPLLNLLGQISAEGKAAHFTLGITPVLSEMLASPLFRSVFVDYVHEKMQAASLDRRVFEARGQGDMAALAEGWEGFYASRLADFTDRYGSDLLRAFRQFMEEGQIEMIASAATHAYLPLLSLDSSIEAQIAQGIATYGRHFSREPEGMWLPECAYRPRKSASVGRAQTPARRGIEDFLAGYRLKYFFLDGRHLTWQQRRTDSYRVEAGLAPVHAAPGVYQSWSGDAGMLDSDALSEIKKSEGKIDIYGVYATGAPGARVSFFIRDTETSEQVWSSLGYPGDPWYLEFHKKRDPGGLRYWRVTDQKSDLGAKMVYEPEKAQERMKEHAGHFAALLEKKLHEYHERTGRTGVLTLSFDAELFGHWWFEGIPWLGALVSAFDTNYVTIEKASTALKGVNPLGAVSLPEGSWGQGGRHLLWHNKETAWTWQHLYEAERDLGRAVTQAGDDGTSTRLLKQMARELLLAQSSDWQFLISTKTAGDYGESRFLGHWHACKELYRMFGRYTKTGILREADIQELGALEAEDALFDDLNLEWFKERKQDGL
jgi:1,4-alpha-glucan branching enzyme